MHRLLGLALRRSRLHETPFGPRLRRLAAGRWLPFLVAVAVLLLLGFHTVTDSSRLAHSRLLDGADWVGYAICHRITSRSFSINGRQLALCARCTGIYLGVMITFVVLVLAGRLRHSELPRLPILLLLAGFIGVMGIDGINSYLHFFPNAPHIYEPRNWLRLVTGMGTGLAVGLLIFPALAQTLWRSHDPRPVVTSFREVCGLLLVAAAVVFLVLSNEPAILYVLTMTSAVGVLLVLSAIQTVMLLVLFRRDGMASTIAQATVPMMVALLLTFIEIGVIDFVRFSFTGTMTGFPGL